MKKLLTRAIVAGVLLAVFSVYGDTSNLVFYSDFENANDGQLITTAADLNEATLAPPSLYDQTPPIGWSGSPGKNSTSAFLAGAASMMASLNMRLTGGALSGTQSKPALFKGTESVRFSYDFKCNGGSKGVSQTITGYDGNNAPVFIIVMGGIVSSPQFQVTVNGVPIGIAYRSNSATVPLNSLSLTLNSDGISATLINGSTLAVSTVNGIPVLGGAGFSKFTIMPTGGNNTFDYDNFQIWTISKVPPPPRLDLYMLTP
jgi:hypothetical protein